MSARVIFKIENTINKKTIAISRTNNNKVKWIVKLSFPENDIERCARA